MNLSFIFLSAFSLTIYSHSAMASLEAHRPENVDYTVFERNVRANTSRTALASTPLGSARIFNEAALPKATAWKSIEDMQLRFEEIRDNRFMTLANEPNFPRRISWLYPKDGCWVRASLFNRNAFRLFIPIPKKVFAFGNLRVNTQNSPLGVVGWWYHVAPIVQVGEEKYVLDPAIEPEKPLLLKDWVARMGNSKRIKVAICSSGTYSPGDNCRKETDGLEIRAHRAQMLYLALEEKELKRMGRNPDAELGDTPPWL